MQIVDVHAHFVPPSLPSDRGRHRLWPNIERSGSGQAAVIVDGKLRRKVDASAWDAATRKQDMAEDGIDLQLVSPFHELLSPELPPEDGDALAAAMNEFAAELVSSNPESFSALGMVPIQDPELATKRLADVKAMGLLGVEIPTHINGTSLGDESLGEFFAEAAAQNLIIMVHPLQPVGVERAGGTGLAAAVSVPCDAALAAAALIGSGVVARHPEICFLLSGGGGVLPYLLPRLDQLWRQIPSIGQQIDEAPSKYASSFYFDTAVYDPRTLAHLVEIVGDERIVMGSDYPFLAKQDNPVGLVKAALGGERSEVIFGRNAATLLGLASSDVAAA